MHCPVSDVTAVPAAAAAVASMALFDIFSARRFLQRSQQFETHQSTARGWTLASLPRHSTNPVEDL